jgi:hypothetical protein
MKYTFVSPLNILIKSSVADPDPGSSSAFSTLDPGWVESQHPDPGSAVNIPDPQH